MKDVNMVCNAEKNRKLQSKSRRARTFSCLERRPEHRSACVTVRCALTTLVEVCHAEHSSAGAVAWLVCRLWLLCSWRSAAFCKLGCACGE